jgi:tight adherence protein B
VSFRRTLHHLKRPSLVATVAILVAGLSGASTTWAAAPLELSQGASATFPARSLVLSVHNRDSLLPFQIHVSENAQPVAGAVVRAIANAGAGDFGVVLAIDVSPSMQGQPLKNAMAAARALARERTGQQQLGVLLFDHAARLAVPLTARASAIAKALAQTPAVGAGTHINDALSGALQQLSAAHVAAGAVILLSDGADRGSVSTEPEVAAAARAAHISLYTVGVRDRNFDPSSLRMLARDGGGRYVEANASQLKRVFTTLEAGLTSRYVLHYRSQAPLGHRVHVSITVEGIPQAATLTYVSPSPPPGLSVKRPSPKSFWVSTLALVLFSCAAALLLGLALFVYLLPRLRRGGLRRRVGEFTAAGLSPTTATDQGPSRPLRALEHMLERMSWWAEFKVNVEIARMHRTAVELIALDAVATIAAAVLVGFALGTPVLSVLVLLLGPLALRLMVKQRLHKQRELFADQLPTHLQELASTMRTGHSLISGITTMAGAATEPACSEWGRVIADEQLGMPLEEAMRPLARRMDSEDVDQVALVAALHHRTGGNMAEVLERVADSVRERAELRRELQALTAQARLSRYVVTALPPVVMALVAVVNPSYVRPLFHTAVGVVLVFVAAGLVLVGSLIMRAITNVKV